MRIIVHLPRVLNPCTGLFLALLVLGLAFPFLSEGQSPNSIDSEPLTVAEPPSNHLTPAMRPATGTILNQDSKQASVSSAQLSGETKVNRRDNAGSRPSSETLHKKSWWESLLIIVYSDAVMSVENILIIAILVSRVPVRIRMVATFIGLVAAGAFRIVFALLATILMKYPVVALLGAITLVFLAMSIFTDTVKQLQRKATHEVEEKLSFVLIKEELIRMFTEKGFWKSEEGEAIKTVMVAVILQDILLSLDNVLVVAGNAHGDVTLTMIGVAISIVMMGTIANFMVRAVQKYPILGFIGGLALAKAAYNLFIDSYDPETAVIAFGSIIVFVMFGRVYHRLTSPDETVQPLEFKTSGAEPIKTSTESASEAAPVSLPDAVVSIPQLSNDLIRELVSSLKKNNEILARIEPIISAKTPE